MQGTKVQKRERGITLIALVVTIIVLLILAGVSIQMLTGQSGILNQARQAKEETEKGQLKESVQREILEGMMKKQGEDLTADEMYKILDKYFKDVTEPGEGEENPWNAENFPDSFPPLQSREGDYTFKLGDIYSGGLSGTQAGEVVPPAGTEVAVPENKTWDTGKVTPTADGEGNVIPIPKDFHYVEGAESGIDEEKDNIGVVIADDEGNEFVWVPVPNAIAETEVSTNTNPINLGENGSKTTPMAETVGGNYRGVLYQTWNTSNSPKTVKYKKYSETGMREREPDIITQYDKVDANLDKIRNILTDQIDKYTNVDTFKSTMQEDYKEMVESVRDYGGFYVGRYELSVVEDKAKSKKGEESFYNKDSDHVWYQMYAYLKKMAKDNGYTNVESSMIWGSQYDAMMNWMARCGIDVESSSITGKSKNTKRITGTEEKDVLNNIYDLLGNSFEWTLEACNDYYRTYRVGYNYDASPSGRYNDGSNEPTLTNSYGGSRASLYIK